MGGDQGVIRFRFKFKAELLSVNMPFFLRENELKCFGYVSLVDAGKQWIVNTWWKLFNLSI